MAQYDCMTETALQFTETQSIWLWLEPVEVDPVPGSKNWKWDCVQ